MLKNYLKLAWRTLTKSKVYFIIHVLGLAAGMSVALLIGLWIWDELSFDSYFPNHDGIVEVMHNYTSNGEIQTSNNSVVPLEAELRSRYKEDFSYLALASPVGSHVLAVGDKRIVGNGMWTQPDLPVMLGLKMLAGDQQALKDPSSIMVTRSIAKALFGEGDPTGKTIKVDNKIEMKVAGVYEDLPMNTTFYDAKFMLPWDKYLTTDPIMPFAKTMWNNHGWQIYGQLKEHGDIDGINAKIKDVLLPHITTKEYVMLYPMNRWYLYGEFRNGKPAGGRIQFVWLFGLIGIFVLLLACINFMNLSTARSENRAKEVGIRKVAGSTRGQLIVQFLIESVVLAMLGLAVTILLVFLSLPFFDSLANKEISIPWGNFFFWLFTVGFAVFTGLVAGSYPALYLSAFEPVSILKGSHRAGRSSALPRQVLVVIQFTVSIVLIIATIIVFRQIQFTKNRPVGYSREGLISTELSIQRGSEHYNLLHDDLLHTGVVKDAAGSSSNLTNLEDSQIGFDWAGKDPSTMPVFGTTGVSHDFGKTIGWKIIDGRDFSRNFPTDSENFVVNEAAVRLIGFKHPVGQTLKFAGQPHVIVGVVQDMIMESPYTLVQPSVFYLDYVSGERNIISIRIKPDVSLKDAIARLEPVFARYDPGIPFQFKFVSDEYARKFSDEQRIGNLASFFATLAIFISCLGLFGLASFVAEQRTKEIAVRKALGASVFSIWRLLSKEFVTLVAISFLVAAPLAWYFLSRWLQQYEYHTALSWWIFAVPGLGALFITLLTISYQSINAAMLKPARSLRRQ
jgi:putative ABC transport system permease protein